MDKEPTQSLAQGSPVPYRPRVGWWGSWGTNTAWRNLGAFVFGQYRPSYLKADVTGEQTTFSGTVGQNAQHSVETAWSPRRQISAPLETSGELTELSFERDVGLHVDSVSTAILRSPRRLRAGPACL